MSTAIKTVHDEMRESLERIKAMVSTAEKEDRDLTADEQKEKDELVARMTALDKKRQRGETFATLLRDVSGLQAPAGAPAPNGHDRPAGDANGYELVALAPPRKSLGQQFVETDIYAALRKMPRGGSWATPVVELEGAVTITPALIPGGVPIVAPLPYPTEWGVAQLFGQGTLDGNMVQYLQETGWTNAADYVAVGGAKPESAKTFLLVQQGLSKIAHWIPVPDEFLEDIAGLRSLIDAQMRNGVVEKVNGELINGIGTGGAIMGLVPLTGKSPEIAMGTGDGAAVTAIAAQEAQVYTLSRLRPDAVVMNPKTWVGIASSMTGSGGFLAGPGVFAAGVPPVVWGLRVVTAPEVADGTAIVGAFSQGGQLFSKGGIAVQATNSHADFFVKNTTAIRAEVRLALAIYRPLAFGLVTGLPTLPVAEPPGRRV